MRDKDYQIVKVDSSSDYYKEKSEETGNVIEEEYYEKESRKESLNTKPAFNNDFSIFVALKLVAFFIMIFVFIFFIYITGNFFENLLVGDSRKNKKKKPTAHEIELQKLDEQIKKLKTISKIEIPKYPKEILEKQFNSYRNQTYKSLPKGLYGNKTNDLKKTAQNNKIQYIFNEKSKSKNSSNTTILYRYSSDQKDYSNNLSPNKVEEKPMEEINKDEVSWDNEQEIQLEDKVKNSFLTSNLRSNCYSLLEFRTNLLKMPEKTLIEIFDKIYYYNKDNFN